MGSTDNLTAELASLASQGGAGNPANPIIGKIQEIDASEKQLYAQLEKIVTDIQSMSNEQSKMTGDADAGNADILGKNIKNLESVRGQLVQQIKQLSMDRIQLYKSLGKEYVIMQTAVDESKDDLIAQKTVQGVMDKELSNIEEQMDDLVEEKRRKMKMVEIDTYYGKRYNSYKELMQLVAYTCIPILIIVVLFRMNMFSAQVRSMLLVLVFIVGGYLLMMKGLDIWYRDNMNWDEYRFVSSGEKQGGESVWEYDKRQWDKFRDSHHLSNMTDAVTNLLGVACYDEGCCNHPGNKVKWDKKKKECVLNKHPLDNQHGSGVGNSDQAAKKSTVSPFTLLSAAPVCNKKTTSLGTNVNAYSSTYNADSLLQNLCQDQGSTTEPFAGF